MHRIVGEIHDLVRILMEIEEFPFATVRIFDEHPPVRFDRSDVENGIGGFLNSSSRFKHGFCLTNTGRLKMDGDYGPVQFELVDVTATVRFAGFPILQSVYTFRDRLRCTYTWPEPLLTRTHALELTAAVESNLQAMVR